MVALAAAHSPNWSSSQYHDESRDRFGCLSHPILGMRARALATLNAFRTVFRKYAVYDSCASSVTIKYVIVSVAYSILLGREMITAFVFSAARLSAWSHSQPAAIIITLSPKYCTSSIEFARETSSAKATIETLSDNCCLSRPSYWIFQSRGSRTETYGTPSVISWSVYRLRCHSTGSGLLNCFI